MLENQQNLKNTEDQFKRIFKALPTPIYIWKKVDNNLILIDYNDAANEIVKGNMKSFLGIRATELYKDNPQILEDLTRCTNGEIVRSKEMLYKYRSLDKEKKLLVSYKCIPPDLIIVHTDDITIQKDLEDSLKKSEREKSIIFENIPEFIVFQDDQHNIIWANKAACDSVDLPLEDLIGRKCYNIWHNNNKIIPNCPVDTALKSGKAMNGEIISPDGTIWDIRVYLVKDENNKIVGVIETTIDITERRHAEIELKKKQLALESIFRAAPVGIGEVIDRVFTQVNDRFCDLVGYTRVELIGKSARIVYPTNEDYDFVGKVKYDLIKKYGIGTVETRFLRKDGKILDILLSSAKNDIKDPLAGVTFTALDITDRKKAEEKLNYQANLVENISDAIISTDIEFNIISWNKTAESIYGWRADEAIGKNIMNIIPVEFIYDKPQDILKQLFEKGHWRGEVIQPGKNDRRIFILASVSLIKDVNGKPIGVVAINRDITDIKIAEKKFEKTEERFKYLISSNPAIIYTSKISGDYGATFISENVKELIGYTPKDFTLNSEFWINQVHPDDKEKTLKLLQELPEKEKLIYNYRFKFKDGTYHWIRDEVKLLKDKEGNPIEAIGSIIDITHQKKADYKLKKSEKKYREAYNRSELYKDLFTHDINNILQNLLSSVELSKLFSTDPSKTEKIKEISSLVSEQIIRGKKLVSNVQKLSEVEEIKTPISAIEASKVLTRAIEFVISNFPNKTLNVQSESFQEQYYVFANDLLINIFENLLFNAVKHNIQKVIEILIRISKEFSNGTTYIKFEFLDNGVGIPNSMKKEIFSRELREYKNDKVPSGIGLGLLLVKRILDTYNGIIKVEDNIQGDYSKGSNFIILIPEAI